MMVAYSKYRREPLSADWKAVICGIVILFGYVTASTIDYQVEVSTVCEASK